MRIIIVSITCFNLLLVSVATVSAQNVIPPPGFVPGQEDDIPISPISPPPPPVPHEPRVFTGIGDDTDPYTNFNSAGPARRYGATGRGSVARTFPPLGPPELIVDDGPPLPIVWFRAEALYWWSKSSPVPVPVLTQGNINDPFPGAIGQPGTSILLGNQNMNLPGQGGGRFTFGFSFGGAQTWGFEASYFSLATASVGQAVFSDGSPGSALLTFPFFNPLNSHEDSSPIALPGSFAGTAVLSTQSFLQATDLNLLHNVLNSNGIRVDLLGGFRNVNLNESLGFATDSPNVPPNAPAFFKTFDSFGANNNFYGGQFGVRASYDVSRFFVNATGKLAVGGTFESVSVNGGTFTNAGGGFSSANGAYLTQPSNMGTFNRDQFAVVPEMNLNFGFRLRPWASIIVGYSFLYISSVARPGDQIDRVINPSGSSAISNNFPANPVGLARPELTVHNTDFWAQGLNFALEFRF